jgi:hypothetical protein
VRHAVPAEVAVRDVELEREAVALRRHRVVVIVSSSSYNVVVVIV